MLMDTFDMIVAAVAIAFTVVMTCVIMVDGTEWMFEEEEEEKMNLVRAYEALVRFRNENAERLGGTDSGEIRGLNMALAFLNDLIDDELNEMAEDYYQDDQAGKS